MMMIWYDDDMIQVEEEEVSAIEALRRKTRHGPSEPLQV